MLFQPGYESGYYVLRILQDSFTEGDVEALKKQIEDYLDEGKTKIALTFTPDSYPYSKLLTLLTQCHRLAAERGGKLVIVHPNPDFHEIIEQTKLGNVLEVYTSEDEIP
jgi:anti-anti-sigma regulatory factor